MPFPAHGLATRRIGLDMDQNPYPPPGEACAGSAIVLRQATVDIPGPADIGPIAALAEAAENIDEAGRIGRLRHDQPPISRDKTSTALSSCGSLPPAYS